MWYTAPGQKTKQIFYGGRRWGKKQTSKEELLQFLHLPTFLLLPGTPLCPSFLRQRKTPKTSNPVAFKNRAQTAFQVGAFKDEMKQKLRKSY